MSGFGSGFGAPAPFGSAGFHQQQQQQQQQNAFGGSATPSNPFGTGMSSPATFGSPPSAFPTPDRSTFGGGMTFGMSPNVAAASQSQPFGAPSFGHQQASTTFGQQNSLAPASTPFGPSTPFVATAPTGPFGGNNTTTQPSFGSFPPASSNPFGSQQTQQPLQSTGGVTTMGSNNPFGAATASAPAMSFGTSSNIVQSTSNSFTRTPSHGFSTTNQFAGTASPWGAPRSGFGTSSNNAFSPSQSDDDNMMSPTSSPQQRYMSNSPIPKKKKDREEGSRSNLPFGKPGNNKTGGGSSPVGTFSSSDKSSHEGSTSSFGPTPGNTSTLASAGPFAGGTTTPPFGASSFSGRDQDKDLARLNAELELKKKALQEKLKKKKAAAAAKKDSSSNALNPDAPSFMPKQGDTDDDNTNKELAERNTVRFSTQNDALATRAHLPADLQQRQQQLPTSLHVHAVEHQREDLHSAVSLVGTCEHMCPDEELLRRERESDIQLLEMPLPGKIHPSDWTLRNTVVKRFRRSAADYKLDVPEWIRPPDVLEKVVGYLEEWVMERDRQGPDPRFNNGTAAPLPLDVYQFIWDRTRMIRKDFTLQNFVGTGGMCDARAVRCHERIARWHPMCEHQLSHIPDFVKMQSQQNIQELGQTMKTLNQFYDDSLGRSRVEVPDENGRETRSDWSKTYKFGCTSDVVQGPSPVDYDGTPLLNSRGSGSGLIPPAERAFPSHGTAEPEMRGLYILLTLDNDGGSEVLNYAARLFRDRPDVYHTKPVQLALSIYKAKKEFNYARFFAILRSPSTPYLFACIMFKYVEAMRRIAFRIFSKTYGARTKENEAFNDAYPLKTLVRVLCFEDLEEARAACKHFNITVKETEVKSSSGHRVEDVIFWRQSSFREPRDPEKGFSIPLKPSKMIRTIESKLKGATRLAVCRGAASGEGSFLGEQAAAVYVGPVDPVERKEMLNELTKREEIASTARLQKEEEERRERLRQDEQRLLLEKQKLLFEEKRREQEEAERERLRKEQEEAERREQAEKEAAERKAKEVARRQAEAEARKRAQEEESRRREVERRRQEDIREKERLAELERQRAGEERKKQEALELERRRAEEARRKEEEERKRRELERKRKQKERLEREAEAIRLHLAWKNTVNTARKRVAFSRLLQRVPRRVFLIDETHQSMKQIGYGPDARRIAASMAQPSSGLVVNQPRVEQTRWTLETLIRQRNTLPVSKLLREVAESFSSSDGFRGRGTFLYKVAVCVPQDSPSEGTLCNLARMWLADRLGYGRVFQGETNHFGVRVAFVDRSVQNSRADCDAAFVVSLQTHRDTERVIDMSTAGLIPAGVPCVGLVISEDLAENRQRMESVSSGFAYFEAVDASRSDLVDSVLFCSVKSIVEAVVALASRHIERISVLDMCYRCINKAIWHSTRIDSHQEILNRVSVMLDCLLDAFRDSCGEVGYNGWPSQEFATNGLVRDYFGERLHLPLDWKSSLEGTNVEARIRAVESFLNGHLFEVVTKLVANAPLAVQHECQAMLDERAFRRCLQMALAWKVKEEETDCSRFGFFYMPKGVLHRFVEDAACRFSERLSIENTHEYNEISGFVDHRQYEWTPISSPLNLPLKANEDLQAMAEVLSVQTPRARPSGTKKTAQEGKPDPEGANTRKRRRLSRGKQPLSSSPSQEVADSIAYTKKLQAMLGGDTGMNRIIGSTTLSQLLHDIPSDLIETSD